MKALWKQAKAGMAACLAAAVVAGTAMVAPDSAMARVDKTFSDPIPIGHLIENVAVYDASFGVEDGRQVMYTTASGTPAIFQVVDLINKEVLRTFPLEGSDSSWAHVTLPDGTVYIGGNGKLYQYSPETKQLVNLGGIGESVTYDLSYDEQGRVYFGTFPNAKVGRYDPATGEFRDYGTVAPGQSYVRSTAYKDGYLYAGVGIEGKVVKVNVETGDMETIELPTFGGAIENGQVYQIDTAGKYIVAGPSGGSNALLFYNTETEEWEDTYFLNNKGIHLSYGKPGSNKVYFMQNNRLIEVDLETLTAVDTGVEFGSYLRHTEWVEVPDDSDLPGASLATVMFNGSVAYLNLETKKTKVVLYPLKGSPIPIQTLEKGPDGNLYVSGYPGGKGTVYSPDTGEMQSFALGQAEGMGSLGEKIYMGIYPGAVIFELDTTQPIVDNVNPKQIYDIPADEDRPFIIKAGEGKVFIGTIPDYGKLGGALTVYDPSLPADEAFAVYPNVVHNQAIVGLAILDGKVYGSTTVAGGLDADPTEPAAKLFVWDIASGTKVKEVVPNIPGATVQPKMISGLTFGPDGLLWAAADGSIFAMDPETLEVVKSKNIYPNVANYGRWRPVHIRWSEDGLAYTTLAGRLTIIDPDDLDHVTLANAELMTLGDDEHIYYASGAQLMKVEVAEGTGELPIRITLPVPNGSFDAPVDEDGMIPGWSSMFPLSPNVSYGISEERAASAPYSLKITDQATNETVALQSDPIPVTPGTEYTASVKLFLESGRTLASFRFYDADGKELLSDSVQVTTGHGDWQTLTMSGTAPEGAVYARVVLFCSNFWMTTAYYDDVTMAYQVKVSPSGLAAMIAELEQEGAIAHSLSKKLQNAVRQAIHHKDDGRIKQAVKHLEDALKHLEHAKDAEVTPEARSLLEQVITAFIADWQP